MKHEFNFYVEWNCTITYFLSIKNTCLIFYHHMNIVGYGRLLEINYKAFIEIYLSVPSKS